MASWALSSEEKLVIGLSSTSRIKLLETTPCTPTGFSMRKTVKVNKASRNYTMHPHGVQYEKDSEGK